MTEDYGEGVVRRFWEGIFGEGDLDVVDEVCAPNFRLHDLVYWEIHHLEDVKHIVGAIHLVMPGTRVVVEDQRLTEDREVFTRFTVRVQPPQDPEEYGETTPSEAEWEYGGMSLSRVVGGKVEESRFVWEAIRADEELEPIFTGPEWRWPPWK